MAGQGSSTRASCQPHSNEHKSLPLFSGLIALSHEARDYFLDRTSYSPPSCARPGSWFMDSRLWQKWRDINNQLNLTSETEWGSGILSALPSLLVWSFSAMASWLKSQFAAPSDNSFTPDHHDVGSTLYSGVEGAPWFVFLSVLFQRSPIFLHEQCSEPVTHKRNQPCLGVI